LQSSGLPKGAKRVLGKTHTPERPLGPVSANKPSVPGYSWEIRPHFDDDPPGFQPLPEPEAPPDPQTQIDRLHRQLNAAKATIARQDDLIKTLRKALDNVGTYLYRGLHHAEWGTRARLRRLISRVFGARDYKGHDG